MAIEIRKKFSVDLSTVVNSSLDAVRAVRRREQAVKEAEFQKAIADGLSYEDQLVIREKQLEDVQKSNLFDATYIEDLRKSIADTKKLGRFSKYRSKYASALAELSAGKINEEDFLSTLKGQLVGIDDPDLRVSIQNDIADAEKQVKVYHDTILSNQVKKAQYDGTTSTLNDAISRVKKARNEAALNDNEDEVTAYDATLSALNSQLATTKIQDAVTNFQVTNSTRGTSPVDKLNFINQQLSSSDSSQPIKVGDRSFDSAAQYWSVERENYLAGGSKIFGDFFSEVETKAKNDIAVDAARFGYPTAQVLDSALKQLNDLSSKPEVAPYASKLELAKTSIMVDAVDKLAKKIVEVGEFNTTFREADQALKDAGARYGIDTTSYQISLAGRLANLVQANIISPEEAKKIAPDVNIELPKVLPPTPLATPTPAATPGSAGGGTYTVKGGDTLSAIAKNAGISLNTLLDLNPQFKSNPNLIRPGQAVNLGQPTAAPAAATPAPAAAPQGAPAPSGGGGSSSANFSKAAGYTGGSIVDFLSTAGQATDFNSRAKLAAANGISNYTGTAQQNVQLLSTLKTLAKQQASAPAPTPTPAPAPSGGGTTPKPSPTPTPSPSPAPKPSGGGGTPAPAPAPKPTPTPPPPAPAPKPSVYSGSSIVDYLKSIGQSSDFNSRSSLARSKGISNYTGTADQNTQLLKKLRGF